MGQYANFYNDKNGDRIYDAESFAEWLKPFFVNGVFSGHLQVLAKERMNIKVTTGYGYINGKNKYFENETNLTLELANPNNDRIDTIVLRRNDTERDFNILILKGNPSSNPQPAPLVRSGAIYDLALAEIRVKASSITISQADITDTRMDSSKCGWVVGAVKQIEFNQITKQFNAFIQEYFKTTSEEFSTWFNGLQKILGHSEVAQIITAISENINPVKENVQRLQSQFERELSSGGNLRIQITQNERKANQALNDAQSSQRTAGELSSKVSALESKDRARENIINERSIRSIPQFHIPAPGLSSFSSPPWDRERVVRFRGFKNISGMTNRSKVDITFEPKTAKNVVMLETTDNGFYIYCKNKEEVRALDGVWWKDTYRG